jgi:hypothetical protein
MGIQGPTIDFRSFLSGRGVATHFIGTAGGALFDDAAFISSFGLQFDHPAGYAGQAPFPGAAPVAATGWTGDLPETFSPAQEMRLRVLDFGVDKYGLNAWIFDSTDDSTTNYDKVLFSKTKDAADSVGTLAKGEWADVQVIGTQVNDITRAPTRLIESEMGNMVTDAMRTKYPGVEAAFTNSGGLRQDLLFAPPSAGEAPGEITWGEVFAVLPFGNRTTILTLTGDQLRAAFINGFTPFCQPGFPGGTGRFAQVSGLNVQFHCDGIVPVVDNMWKATDGVGGTLTPIGPADSLRIVTNDFMFGGGDGYTTFAGGTDVAQPGDDLLQVTIDYITAKRSNAAGLIRCDGNGAEVPSAVACPTPNLGSGAHATGISGAKGAQPSGRFGSTPSGRARGSVSLSAAA